MPARHCAGVAMRTRLRLPFGNTSAPPSRRTPPMSLEIPYRSIPDMLAQRVAATPHGRAFGFPTADDGIGWMTWGEVGARAANIGAGLLDLGIRPEDRVAILSNTRVEWLLADFGIMNAGGATTTVYPTTEPDEAAFIVRDSESVVLIAENAAQAMKVSGANLEFLRQIVLIDDPDAGGDGGAASAGVPVMSLAELERRGAQALSTDPELVARVVAAVEPRHL